MSAEVRASPQLVRTSLVTGSHQCQPPVLDRFGCVDLLTLRGNCTDYPARKPTGVNTMVLTPVACGICAASSCWNAGFNPRS